jgi:retron-type reverse transcriptase
VFAVCRGRCPHRSVVLCLFGEQAELKTDIAKYFDSIDHDILLNLVEKKVKGKKALPIT